MNQTLVDISAYQNIATHKYFSHKSEGTWWSRKKYDRPVFNCSKSTMETLEQCVKFAQITIKATEGLRWVHFFTEKKLSRHYIKFKCLLDVLITFWGKNTVSSTM